MEFQLLIVNFHYFRENKPVSGIYPVSKAAFLSQIDALSTSFNFCSQTDIVNWLSADAFPLGKYCLITFDDGLAEQMGAFELLIDKGIPAVFYVPAGPYLSDITLGVHKLHYIRSVISDEELYRMVQKNSLFVSGIFDERLMNAQYRYDSPLTKKIKYFFNFILTPTEANQIVNEIFSECISDEVSFVRNFYMSHADLVKLASYRMLGSHGTGHKPFASLSEEECKLDITESLTFFEGCTGSDITSFSYPFGSKAAVNQAVARQLSGTSVEFALTMFRGINSADDLRSRYLLKRVDTNDAPGGKHPLPELR